MKKIIFSLFATLFIVSCEKDQINEISTHNVSFKFNKSENLNDKNNKNQFLEFEVQIIRNGSKLELISDELEMSKAINQETGEESYVIHQKSSDSSSLREVNPKIVAGYFYDGNDCWIYGTWYHGDNGQSLFVPASAQTQYVMNICGWSNVA